MNPRIFSIAIAALLCIAKRQSMLSLLLITLAFLTGGAALAATLPSAAPIQSSSFPATAFPSQVSPTLPGLSYPERPHPNVTPRSYRAQMFHGQKPDYSQPWVSQQQSFEPERWLPATAIVNKYMRAKRH